MVFVMFNTCYGGFGFSKRAEAEYRKRIGIEDVCCDDVCRTDPVMVQIVKELGEAASGEHAEIELAELDDKYAEHFEIGEYDGNEWIKINYDRYALDSIRKAIQAADGTSDAKLGAIERILDENRAIKQK